MKRGVSRPVFLVVALSASACVFARGQEFDDLMRKVAAEELEAEDSVVKALDDPPPGGLSSGQPSYYGSLRGGKAFAVPAPTGWGDRLEHRAEAGDACACQTASPCDWYNGEVGQPVDPLKWCAVRSDRCALSTNDVHVVAGTELGTLVEPHAEHTTGTGWRHCAAGQTFWDWEGAKSIRTNVKKKTETQRQREHEAGIGLVHDPTKTPVRMQRELPHTPAHALSFKMTPHHLFHVDCVSDGTGANAQYWWYMLGLAMVTRMHLLVNPQHWISENSPMYAMNLSPYYCKVDHKHGIPCVTPSDVYTPMGIYNGGAPVAKLSREEAFARAKSGEFATHFVGALSAVALPPGVEGPHRLGMHLNTLAATWKKPTLVVIKRCNGELDAGQGAITGLLPWIRHAYESTRRVLRPDYPAVIASLQPHHFSIVMTVRRGDSYPYYDQGKWHGNPWFTPMSFYAGVARNLFAAGKGFLDCNNAKLTVVSEINKAFEGEFDALNEFGPKGQCWLPAFSSFEQETPKQSATSMFRDLDLFSTADVFIGSKNSAFSALATAFMDQSAIKFFSGFVGGTCLKEYGFYDRSYGGNLFQTDGKTGCFDRDDFKRVWFNRDPIPTEDPTTNHHHECSKYCAGGAGATESERRSYQALADADAKGDSAARELILASLPPDVPASEMDLGKFWRGLAPPAGFGRR